MAMSTKGTFQAQQTKTSLTTEINNPLPCK